MKNENSHLQSAKNVEELDDKLREERNQELR